MKVLLSERVKTALKTLSHDDRERLHAWLQYLQNWETDPFAKSQSVVLDVEGRPVHLFRTTTDTRIFYTVDEATKTIHVLAVTDKDTILSSGGIVGGTV